jgi:hypothetical protein
MFRLAGHLGMTVRELCERMDAVEFREWSDYLSSDEGSEDGLESVLANAIQARK